METRESLPPTTMDREALQEFIESLSALAPAIERDVARLKSTPDDREVIGSLFRAIHNIKGDAALCKVEVAVRIAHPIEALLARLRNHEVLFTDITAEALLLALDRLELASDSLYAGKTLDPLRLPALIGGLERLANAPAVAIDEQAASLIEVVTGFRPAAELSNLIRGRTPSHPGRSSLSNTQRTDDLRFFRSLADQLEARSPLFKGRTLRLLRLSFETNQMRGRAVDPTQLEAAVYMHDVGMMFLPESTWLKPERMSIEERSSLRSHPQFAAGLLARMDGWQEAAQMVEQHHEMPDGEGYPAGLKAPQIVDGAKILAIVDAFEAIMLKHINRGKNRSVLRAIAKVNACDKQFAPEWIEPFNQVIRRTVEAK